MKQIIGDCELHLGDCMEVMAGLGKVDAVITSPPYDDLRKYGDDFKGVDCLAVIGTIAKLLKDGGVCMWNTGDATVAGSETGSSFKQALHAIDCGLSLHDTMIYCKPALSFPDKNRYYAGFEYMFIFSKGAPLTFNPIADKENKSAGRIVSGTERQKDGSTNNKSGNGRIIGKYSRRFNYWTIANQTRDKYDHPAKMPFSMAHDHAISWTNENETILDPFMGSGTTGAACIKTVRKFIGIEQNTEYFDIACQRIEDAYSEMDQMEMVL